MRMHHHHRPGLWPGLILVSLGAGLLAHQLGLLPAHVRFIDFWPLCLVFAGVSNLFRARSAKRASLALVLMALGGLLLARNLGFVSFSTFPAARLWPAFLVLFGVALLIRAARGSDGRGPPPAPWPPASPASGYGSEPVDDFDGDAPSPRGLSSKDERLDKQVTFSGLDFKIESGSWQGGVLGVTAGGVGLDLRYARLAPEGALLDVQILMGGVDIRVPDTWQVQCDVTPFLGGADDTTRSTQGSSSAPVLRVVGSVTLGGLSIRN